MIGRRDQLPDRLSPAAYLDLDPTVPLGLRPHLVDRPVDRYVARPVPHHLTSHVRLCEEYDGPGTVAGHRWWVEPAAAGPGYPSSGKIVALTTIPRAMPART